MIGYKVLSKDGLKGPFKKSSILKAITSATLPLQARLLDLQTGMYIRAADLVGEEVERPARSKKPAPEKKNVEDGGLKLAEEAPEQVEPEGEEHVVLSGKLSPAIRAGKRTSALGKSLKAIRLPKPRKLNRDADELELSHPAA
jgi:hypothetical protein